MYHYLECGLDDVYLVNGYPWLDSIDSLHTTIGKLLVQKAGSLDGCEILFFRRELGLSQKVLGKRLDVNLQTVWRWENDKGRIKPDKDVSLRALYLDFIGCLCSKKVLAKLMSRSDQDSGLMILEQHQKQWYLSPRKNLSNSTP